MPFKDIAKQSAYQVQWLRTRRQEWLKKKGPCPCGADKDLRVVKKDASTQHVKVFGWSEEMRKPILKKCRVLCTRCMVKHYGDLRRQECLGKKGKANLLNAQVVWAIRGRLMGRDSCRKIAVDYKIAHSDVSDIKNGHTWAWLKPGKRKVYGINTTIRNRRTQTVLDHSESKDS